VGHAGTYAVQGEDSQNLAARENPGHEHGDREGGDDQSCHRGESQERRGDRVRDCHPQAGIDDAK
jgi:hypothetical protein